MQVSILSLFSVAAIISGILVITIKNPIVSVLYLIGLFLCISIYLMLLGVNFIGLSYLLVYVGAVSILFLFILMLINIRISEIATSTSNNIPLAIIIGTCFFYTVIQTSPSLVSFEKIYTNLGSEGIATASDKLKYTELLNKFKSNNIESFALKNDLVYNYTMSNSMGAERFATPLNANNPDYLLSQSWANNIIDYPHIVSIGNVLYTSYPLWLLITSLILLLAMVGTIIITMKERKL